MAITIDNARDAERWLQSLPAKLRAYNAVDEFIRRTEPRVSRMKPMALARFREIQATHEESRRALLVTIDGVKAAAQRALTLGRITPDQFAQLNRVGLSGFVVVGIVAAVAVAIVAVVGYLTIRAWARAVEDSNAAQRGHVAAFLSLPPEQRGDLVDLVDNFPAPPPPPVIPSPGGVVASGLSAAALAIVAGVLLFILSRRS